eukprot:scpid49808/ scgid7268/ Radial spoke head 10 homolog B
MLARRAADMSADVEGFRRAASAGGRAPLCDEDYLEPALGAVLVQRYQGGRNVGGFFHGRGTAELHGGHTYQGQFQNGYIHGKGLLTFANGIKLDGEFVNNKPDGFASIFYPDGSEYKGNIVNGTRHGSGVYVHEPSKTLYKGDWVNGVRTGKGRMVYCYTPMESYDGDWTDNVRNGHGKQIYKSGNTYEGNWVNGCRTGHGCFTWTARSERYTGQWKNGIMHGHGEHRWMKRTSLDHPIQTHYVGDFVEGIRQGHGTMCYSNGMEYSGSWENNLKHGKGTITSTNGVKFSGTFENNIFSGVLPKEVLRQMGGENGSGEVQGARIGREDAALMLLLGDIGGHSCDDVDATRTYNYVVEQELLAGISEDERHDHLLEVHNALLKYIDRLEAAYAYYNSIGKDTDEVEESQIMTRSQFWVLCEDLQLYRDDYTFAQVDRIVGKGLIEGKSLHDPNYCVPFRLFLQWITFLAFDLYKEDPKVQAARYPLAVCVSKFVRNDLGQCACQHQSLVYQRPELLHAILPYRSLCYDFYKALCSMDVMFQRPRPVIEGEEQLPTASDFMMMLKTLKLYSGRITHPVACDAIATTSPNAHHADTVANMEHEITYHQVFTALALCSVHGDDPPAGSRCVSANVVSKSSIAAVESEKVSEVAVAVDRFAQLFQAQSRGAGDSDGSQASLDGAPSRLSATPSQTGTSTGSHTSLGSQQQQQQQQVRGRKSGAASMEGPVAEVVTETNLESSSTGSLRATSRPESQPDSRPGSQPGSRPSSRPGSGKSTERSQSATSDKGGTHGSQHELAQDSYEKEMAKLSGRLEYFFRAKLTPAFVAWQAGNSQADSTSQVQP